MFFEPLESRRLLSITLKSGVLTVDGGKTDDVISFTLVQERMHVNMQRGKKLEFDNFAASRIDRIVVKCKAGNDTVSVPWFDFEGRTTVSGGKGIDSIAVSTKGKAVISGGPGSDVLRGGSGNDLIKGNGGHDSLVGNAGNDTLIGGKGGDIFQGMAGKDLLRARDGRTDTHFSGGDGRDTLELDLGKDVADDPETIERFKFLNGIEVIRTK